MTTEQLPWLTRPQVVDELLQAERDLALYLTYVREFPTYQAEHPWLYLEELLRDVRGTATTVRALSDLLRAYPE